MSGTPEKMSMKTNSYEGIRTNSGIITGKVNDELVTEEALTVMINGEALTVTMQTPGNELELVRGLLFTEGIFKDRRSDPQLKITERNKSDHISRVDVFLDGDQQSVLNKRTLLSVSACGICGKKEIEFVSGSIEPGEQLIISNLPAMFEKMSELQFAFNKSGGCHAAAAFTQEGELISVMEDVGRHNAVDKVIGDLLFKKLLGQAKFLLVSGRVSYEIVAKTFAGGIPVLAAVSAPSTLAVDFAKELGITLLGFCRGDRATIYSHPERL